MLECKLLIWFFVGKTVKSCLEIYRNVGDVIKCTRIEAILFEISNGSS